MIRLINTTTSLPIDKVLEDSLFAILNPKYADAVTSQWTDHHVDVQFVNQDDSDLNRREPLADSVPDMDLLGIYISHHAEWHRPVIKVSPEKVMSACVLLVTKRGVTLSLDDLYSTVLNAVVIHELAHSLLDERDDPCDTSWSWLIRARLNEDSAYDFQRQTCHCHRRTVTSNIESWRHTVEESLANAFVIRQRFTRRQLDALVKFIELQPLAYRAGLRWKCSMGKLIETAESWCKFKSGYVYRSRWLHMLNEPNPLGELANRLMQGTETVKSFDFDKTIHQHMLHRLSAWQVEFERNKDAWDNFLNGTGGVLYELVSRSGVDGLSPTRRLKLLRQWSSNGSSKAVEEFNTALSEASVAKGDFKTALKCQLIRQKNVQ